MLFAKERFLNCDTENLIKEGGKDLMTKSSDIVTASMDQESGCNEGLFEL